MCVCVCCCRAGAEREGECECVCCCRAGSKKVQVVRLSQLSVEELREQVASFEHGKVGDLVVSQLFLLTLSPSLAFPHLVCPQAEVE